MTDMGRGGLQTAVLSISGPNREKRLFVLAKCGGI